MMVSLALQKVKSDEGKWDEREEWRNTDVYGEGVVTLPSLKLLGKGEIPSPNGPTSPNITLALHFISRAIRNSQNQNWWSDH